MSAPVPLGNFDWEPASWRRLPAAQQPGWPDVAALQQIEDELRHMPPLVFAGEARSLKEGLARVSEGNGFLLQAGDCAESFAEFSADSIRDKLKVILQMSVVLTYSTGVPTLKIGRIAGQFAKPRSAPTETRDGVELESFFGDIVNDIAFDFEARRPDAARMLRGYNQAAATLNLLRAFTKGGFADLNRVHQWNLEFIASAREGQRYEELAAEIERALQFMAACGIDLQGEVQLHQVDFYTSHEALLLEYEEALTRRDSLSGDWYDCSAHLLWIGHRTHQLSGAHVEFLSGIQNPIGLKVGADVTPEELVALCRRLDPAREPGRLVLVSRMGEANVAEKLPPLLRAVQRADHPVVWACDPMHGNTFAHESGYKTRHFDAVMHEVEQFFDACRTANVWPGGVHVELTGDDVTECLGGGDDLSGGDLERRYETRCDPRLNARQSLDLAFRVCELVARGTLSDTFSDVDRSDDVDGAISWLDRIDSWPQMRAYKERSYALCDAAPPSLDVGAGTGTDALRLGAFGCDFSKVMCTTARARGVSISRADAHALPFRDGAFGAVRSDRVLQHVADPARALDEFVRVCAPGGRVVVCDPDQESLTIHVPGASAEMVARIKALRRDVGTRNGTFVHRIPELLVAAKCHEVTVEAFPLVLTDPDDAFGLPGWARYWANHFSPAEVAEWERCVAKSREGGFVFALLYLVVAGTTFSDSARGTR